MVATRLHACPLKASTARLSPLHLSPPNTRTNPISSSQSSLKPRSEMAIKNAADFPFSLLLCCILCLWAALCVASAQEDPQLQRCKHQCRIQREASEHQKEECEQKCEDYYREHRGPVVDPEKQLQQCLRHCELLEPGTQGEDCRRQCRDKYYPPELDKEEEEEEEEEDDDDEERGNPFVFRDQNFASFRTDRGEMKILEKFDQRSRLLRGLKNYRFIYLEANSQTFVVPAHYDADIVGFVARGQGAITMVCQGKRRGFRIRTGDIVRIPAGTTFQLINSDRDRKLRIIYFLFSVGIPGRFEPFHGAAGENPQSFYRAFSPKLLSSAFKVKVEEETLERVFQQQTKGNFIKATAEQIQTLTRQNGRPFNSGESKRPVFSLLDRVPSSCNNYGRLHEADGNEFRPLKDMDIRISYANISQGGMMGPFYNSRSTMVAAVIQGEGYFEMACPHLFEDQQQPGANPVYQKVTSYLRPGTLVVVPTGHPIAIVAGTNRTLEVVSFGINAGHNRIEPLAGKGNVVNELEKEAKELAFAVPARAVDRVFRRQKQELFFPGPELKKQQEEHHHQHHHHHHGGRAYA